MRIQYFLAIFIFLLLGQTSVAQPPPIEWQKSYGGSGNDVARAMAETSDCGFIIAGQTSSTDGDVTGQHGQLDFWLCRLANDGSLLWQKTYGGSSSDIAYSVQQTKDGGFIAVGYTISNDGDVSGFHGGLQFGSIPPDLWVIKTDASGQLQWQRSLGGKGREIGYSIQLTPDGGYIITGEANENDGDVTDCHIGTLFANTPDVWVVKLSSGGTLEWQKCYGSYLFEVGSSIKPTTDGGYIVTGYAQTTSPDTGDVKGIHNASSGAMLPDTWVIKLSASGTLEWQKCLGGFGNEMGFDIIESRTGGFIVMSISQSIDGDVVGGSSIYDPMWLVKLSNTGNIEWQRIHKELTSFQPRNLTEDDSGNLTIGLLRYNLTGTPDFDKYGIADYLLLKTDSKGVPIWEKTLRGPGNDACFMAIMTKGNDYVICGSSTENGFDVSGNHGLEDFWVVKLNNKPTITINASEQNICVGTPVVFTAAVNNGSSKLHYQWLLNGTTIGIDSNQITLSTLKDNDTISCILSTTKICTVKSDTSNLIIMKISTQVQPSISITASSNKICIGDTVMFNATVKNIGLNSTYQWQVNGSNVGTNSARFISGNLKNNDSISCLLTTSGNCGIDQKIASNYIVLSATSLIQTTVSISASADTICKGSQITFTSTSINTGYKATYQWQLNGQNIGNGTPNITLGNFNNGDKVSLKVRTDTICPLNANPASNIVAINVRPPTPPVNLGADKKICNGTSTTIKPNLAYSQYTWQNGTTVDNIVVNNAGLYWLTAKDACGNVSSDSIVVELFAETKNLLPKDTAICTYESLELKPTASLQFYKWSNFEQSTSIIINKPGVYWLSGNDRNGCKVSDTINISSKECVKGFFIPTAFTPNQDSKNDKFRPLIFGEIEKYEFRIFNRWGEMIFESWNAKDGWDGRFKGIDQPSNTFTWQCIFKLKDESTSLKKGTVLLLR